MRRMSHTLCLLLTTASLFGCSSAEEEEAAACFLDGVVAEPSLRTDIVPILQGSCTFSSSCHGDKRDSQLDLYLGKKKPNPAKNVLPMTDAEVTEMLVGIINVASVTAPAVNIITPGDAEASFLMHKVDNTHKDQGFVCDSPVDEVSHECGDSMPKTAEDILCPTDRDTIRNWINAGAKDN